MMGEPVDVGRVRSREGRLEHEVELAEPSSMPQRRGMRGALAACRAAVRSISWRDLTRRATPYNARHEFQRLR